MILSLKHCFNLVVLISFLHEISASRTLENPEEYVNILGGTDSRYDQSTGGVLPFVARPWGFNGFAPQTDDDPYFKGWWFHPSDKRFFGLRVTHQPSPWIQDYGQFLVKAYMPKDSEHDNEADGFTGYSPRKSTYFPFLFKTTLLAYSTEEGNTDMEFSPTSHGGIMRVSFPKYIPDSEQFGYQTGFVQHRRIAVKLNGEDDSSEVSVSPIDGTLMISGVSTVNSGGVCEFTDKSEGRNFGHFFVLAIYGGNKGNKIIQLDGASHADSNSAWVTLSPEHQDHQVLTVRIATSFISQEQALVNLQRELPADLDFDSVVRDAKQEWHNVLSRIQVGPPGAGYSEKEEEDMYTIFYSSLYRASLFPRPLTEVAVDGSLVHWSPYATNVDARVQKGPLTTDSGFWDAWNTVYPLLSLSNRPLLGVLIDGWLNAYKEGGWLPKWASPGYRGSMVGTMGDVSLASAIVNEIPGFDRVLAYEAIRKDAFQEPPLGVGGVGRECLTDYLKYGYVPKNAASNTGGTCSEVVSRTLNYWQSDDAIARAAAAFGHDDDAATLRLRSNNFSALFDDITGVFRSRNKVDQQFATPFDKYAWGGDYTEGNSLHFRFYVTYNPRGLADLYQRNGFDMCSEIEQIMSDQLSIIHIGGYSSEIHELTELADRCWGQYAHNNQPVHHMLYMTMHPGFGSSCAAVGQRWIRETLRTLYLSGKRMFPGDEDNGEMGAWYVLSAMGLYELAPGSGEFTLGAPLFSYMEVDISDDSQLDRTRNAMAKVRRNLRERPVTKLVVEARNSSSRNMFVQGVEWNGQPLDKGTSTIAYSQLKLGGTLSFLMGPKPLEQE